MHDDMSGTKSLGEKECGGRAEDCRRSAWLGVVPIFLIRVIAHCFPESGCSAMLNGIMKVI